MTAARFWAISRAVGPGKGVAFSFNLKDLAMFESLESRQLFSAALATTETQPDSSTTTAVTESDAARRVPLSDLKFVKAVDKASPVLS